MKKRPKIKRPRGRPRKKVSTKIVPKRPRGRPRVNFTYNEAKQIVRSEGVSSMVQYSKWWKYNLPAKMPKRPDRAYKNDGFSWGDFLGVINLFAKPRKKACSYDEARKYAHTLGLSNRTEWVRFAARSGKKPANIPTRPDIVYQKGKGWVSWRHFLGYDTVQRQEVLVEAVRTILFIVKIAGAPSNVYRIGTTIKSKDFLIDLHKSGKIKILRLFYTDNKDWKKIIPEDCYREYLSGTIDDYVIFNYAEFISLLNDEFTQILE